MILAITLRLANLIRTFSPLPRPYLALGCCWGTKAQHTRGCSKRIERCHIWQWRWSVVLSKHGNVNCQFVFLSDNFKSNGMIYFSLNIVHVIDIGSFWQHYNINLGYTCLFKEINNEKMAWHSICAPKKILHWRSQSYIDVQNLWYIGHNDPIEVYTLRKCIRSNIVHYSQSPHMHMVHMVVLNTFLHISCKLHVVYLYSQNANVMCITMDNYKHA